MASDLFEIGAVTAGLITENSLELRDPSVFYQIQRSVNHTDAVNGMTAGTVQVNPCHLHKLTQNGNTNNGAVSIGSDAMEVGPREKFLLLSMIRWTERSGSCWNTLISARWVMLYFKPFTS